MLEQLTVGRVLEALGFFVGFVAFLFVLSRWVPGRVVQGADLGGGKKQSYRLNGFAVYLITFALAGVGIGVWGVGWLGALVGTYFWPLLIAANIWSFLLTGVLHVWGRVPGDVPQGEAPLKTLWMGASLNPTWWGVDLKVFSYRPSLIGLGLLNWSFACLQYEQLGHLTTGMWLYQLCYFFYLGSSFEYERGMLSMWDVIAERFGFMLIWGDYAVVTFFYCIPAWWLVNQSQDLPLWALIGLGLMFVFGFWVFRGTNEQKNRFKADPNTKIWGKPVTLVGGKLLASGFWGIGRKLNYTGEILVYLSWTMATGFVSIWPFALPMWLFSLLVHRAWRDEQRCHQKYGPIWEAYCQKARFRMIPFIY